MGDWGKYWRDVVAPKLLAKKRELGRAVPERDIASYVEARSEKRTSRQLVWLFLHGEREPYISQFFALCEKLDLDWVQALTPAKRGAERVPLRRVNEKHGTKHAERSRTIKSQKVI